MSAAHIVESTPVSAPKLYLALELAWGEWNVAFTTGMAQQPRLRTIRARDVHALDIEIQRAKERFRLPADTPVISCYEAGRDGFWLHRYLVTQGIESLVVDSASIEFNRRKRRAKSDRLDATKLVTMLIRWDHGEKKPWAVVQIPSPGGVALGARVLRLASVPESAASRSTGGSDGNTVRQRGHGA
jgi:transposase